jgi:dethiobiotin synthetase
MSNDSFRGLFITGSDTGIGKTSVAAALVHHLRQSGPNGMRPTETVLRVGAYKPVVSGAATTNEGTRVWDDVERLRTALGATRDELSDDWISPQRFLAPLAPGVAARAEGRSVDQKLLLSGLERWRERADVVIVEGAGGLLSPITDEWLNADLALRIGWPLVVVSRRGLGAINQALLTVEAARTRGLRVAAVVLNEGSRADLADRENDPSRELNAEQLRHWLPEVPVLETLSAAGGDLRNAPAFRTIDWLSLMVGKSLSARCVDG